MNLKQKQLNHFSKIKYSDIKFPENSTAHESRVAIGWLMKNGYVVMDGYTINEVIKLIRSLRELRVEFAMKVIDSGGTKDNSVFYYEFTLAYFEDDRP